MFYGRVLGSLHMVAAVLLLGTGSIEEKDSFAVEQEYEPVKKNTEVWDPQVHLDSTVLSNDGVMISQVRKLLRDRHIYPR